MTADFYAESSKIDSKDNAEYNRGESFIVYIKERIENV